MMTVLFACVHNAGRSQMAAAFFNAFADRARARAISAGTEPAAQLYPEVVDTMREVGLDLTSAVPQRLTTHLVERAQILVTMGCGETCPVVPGLKRVDWDLPDPKGRDAQQVRDIRDTIKRHVVQLLAEERLQRRAEV